MGSWKISILWLFCTVFGTKYILNSSHIQNSIKICGHYRGMPCLQPCEHMWIFPHFLNTNTVPEIKTRKKRVSFSRIAQIVLIPCRKEYANMFSDLWYNLDDFTRFRWEYMVGMKVE